MNQPESIRGLFCVIDPDGHPIHTHLGTKKEEVIESYLEEERTLLRMIRNEFAPSWEVLEAEGYTVKQMDLIPAMPPMILK